MKKRILCLAALCICTAVLADSKTEIVVTDGLVKTTTLQGDLLIRRGQKAVLQTGKEPSVSFNNIIVGKLLQLDKQIQAERNAGTELIKYTSAQVYSIGHENVLKVGGFLRMPNQAGQASNTCRIGTMSILQDMSFYDFEGNPLTYTIEKVKADEGYYHLQFAQPVEPGEEFRFIMIVDFDQTIEDFKMLEKVDGRWMASGQNGTPYCLNYYHVILPPGAIFVEANPPASVVEEQDGRVAVTIRSYTGPDGDGLFKVSFLWPEKDGPSLQGIAWTNAGPEVVEVYRHFLQENVQSPVLWGRLAIKLVGELYYEEANNAFERCLQGHDSALWDYTALVWLGHLQDLSGHREQAVAFYQQALPLKQQAGNMRHDQWNIVLDEAWIRRRMAAPFTEAMLTYPELNYRQAIGETPPDPTIETGVRIGDLYIGMTRDEVLEHLGQPRHIFYGDRQYTLDNLPDRYYMIYPDLGVFIHDNFVEGLSSQSPFYQLPNGIRVGDSEQRVIDVYGTGYRLESHESKDFLDYDELNLMFEIDKADRTILEINVEE